MLNRKGFNSLILIFGILVIAVGLLGGSFLIGQFSKQAFKQDLTNDLNGQIKQSTSPVQSTPNSTLTTVSTPQPVMRNADSCSIRVNTSSIPSNSSLGSGITLEEAKRNAPLHTAEVTTEVKGHIILIKWPGTGGDGSAYLVCRRTLDSSEWQVIHTIEITGDNRNNYSFEDDSSRSNVVYVYGIRFMGNFGNYSQITESNPLTAP